MGQDDHIRALPAAGRAAAKGPQPARADVHHLTQPLGWERPNMFFDKPEPHGFWLAKNWVAFLRNSLCVKHWGKGKSERFGATVEVGQDARAVAFFVGGCTGVTIGHAKA